VGRLAWHTPNLAQLGAPVQCRQIEIPGDLWQFVTGALLPLTGPENWEPVGDASADVTAAYFEEILEKFLNSMCAYVGEIRPFVLDVLPPGWLPLDGSTISAAAYVDLAAVVPVLWLSGSDIVLPDMVLRGLIGAGAGEDIGDIGGEETHTLTSAEMPAHTHSYEIAIVNTDILGELPAPAINALAGAVTGSTGDGEAHNNLAPYLAVNWGIYSGVL